MNTVTTRRPIPPLTKNDETRFWSKVGRSGPAECWLWMASRTHNSMGYGLFRIGGHLLRAHRVAWMISRGAIPSGLCVLHRCDNPGCCNPSHLFVGTQRDNMEDMTRKGRRVRGADHPKSKLTSRQVCQIRLLYHSGNLNQYELAKRFGLSQPCVGRIVRGEVWKHLLPRETPDD